MWTGTETEIELTLIRHGATKANLEHRYLGKTDESLSSEGRKEIKEQMRILAYPFCDRLFSSPLNRCRETAQIIYPNRKIHEINNWSEIDFGKFEGKNYSELKENPDYQKWIDSNGTMKIPGGESRTEFEERSWKGLLQMIDMLEKEHIENEKIKAVAVVHGGTIMSLCSRLTDGEYFDFQVKNGEGYRCVIRYSAGNIELKKLERL